MNFAGIYSYHSKYVFLHYVFLNRAVFSYLDDVENSWPEQHFVEIENYTSRIPEDWGFDQPSGIPFDVRLQAAFLTLTKDITVIKSEIHDLLHPWRLNDAQLAFMMEHHDEIERAYASTWSRDGHQWHLLETLKRLVSSQAYQETFGNMDWDQAYDRYEDTPGYDPFLKDVLHLKFFQDHNYPEQEQVAYFPEQYKDHYHRAKNFAEQNPVDFQALCDGKIRVQDLRIG